MLLAFSGSPHIHNLRLATKHLRFFRNLVFIPIRIRKESDEHPASCVPFPTAIAEGQVTVTETNTVRSLNVMNSSSRLVFGLAGTYLRGGGQDRTLPISTLIAANASGEIPVRCVEHSRWNGSVGQAFASSGSTSLVGSQVCSGSVTLTQDQVWATVADISCSIGTTSATQCHADTFSHAHENLTDYTKPITDIQLPDRTIGGLFLTYLGKGRLHCALDVFGRQDLFRFYFPHLCESVALTALSGRTTDGANDYRPGSCLDRIWRAVFYNLFCAKLSEEATSLNAGTLLTKTGGKSGCRVAILRYEDKVIHEMLRWDARCAV